MFLKILYVYVNISDFFPDSKENVICCCCYLIDSCSGLHLLLGDFQLTAQRK